jgi:hypothetical protein
MSWSVLCSDCRGSPGCGGWPLGGIAADDSIRLGRDVTLQAARGGETIFANQ